MSANATAQVHPAGSTHQQEASGWSIFWALLAIVLNCMLQPSATGYLWNGDAFEGSLWPHRSSPFICLLDTAADIWMALQRLRGHVPSDADHDNDAVKPGVLTKLALFFLGVLLQAIKLFSVEGIPVTQAVAAIFFISSVVNMLRTLCVKCPGADILALIERLKPTPTSLDSLKITTGVLGWFSHGACMFSFWYTFADRIGFDVSQDVANAVDWATALAFFVSSLYFVKHVFFTLIDFKSPIPPYPIIMILMMAHYGCLADLFGPVEGRKTRGERRYQFTVSMTVSLALGSYLIAYVLDYFVQGVQKWHQRSATATSNDQHLPLYTGSASEGRPQPVQQDHSDTETGQTGVGVGGDLGLGHLPRQHHIDEADVAAEVQISSDGCNSPTQDEVSATCNACGTTPNLEGSGSNTERVLEIPAEEPNSSTAGAIDARIESNATDVEGSRYETEEESWLFWVFEKLLGALFGLANVFIVPAMFYSGLAPLGPREADDVQQRAEEGTFDITNGQPTREPEPSGPKDSWNTIKQDCLRIPDLTLRFAVKWILLAIWRFLMANMSFIFHTIKWVEWQVTTNHPPELLASAFGLANFAMAAVYYLALFDAEGTVAPTWANIFGK
ncbi:hypothetical protein H2200_012424 [Cladophialophora chaetospira]|uniref:Uncharacterized protein n=1 Tax=Cladophialophora chaetospira TaxID=386627 RepID=A0AA38WXV2_9EURO|nr:hypothetical protein H2200_012424 [Cladophialophora chaetospira]